MSEAEKRKTHERILEQAARIFREKGTETTSVSDVMQAAGLTHGGFYRHFKSKDDLVVAAFRNAVDGVLADMEDAASDEEREKAREAYIDTYLSMCHVDNRPEGCPLAALAGNLSRGPQDARAAGFQASERVSDQLREGPDTGQGVALLALMLGTVTLARLAETKDTAQSILDAGRAGVDLIRSEWPG
ncbi:TetR/AcrR family transcriptional regulator [Roseibium album]|uniref:HTH-type transcriptional regulator MtrR n=1 Tax=Roseibium album TaxID=311410 RepID=A0A0M6Z4H9_9HYPH|nr:TetR/AcrR family transcriptional regulator [Roseibium album]CTQ57648.1 HTH-type transcriptional regulator MtrR [Roseibium album]CTQ68761.1 HTH-type transcriptional regulator MtrR [Roseibium album]CTQ70986.1 HTH-type transcriptional regulator MtrR [Roseibium album]